MATKTKILEQQLLKKTGIQFEKYKSPALINKISDMLLFPLTAVFIIVKPNNMRRKNEMKTYNIYEHSTLGTQVVKKGFSFPGLFFGLFWLLYKKLWGYFFLFSALLIACFLIKEYAQSIHSAIAMFAVLAIYFLWFLIGYKGNKLVEGSLKGRGFKFSSSKKADNKDAALA